MIRLSPGTWENVQLKPLSNMMAVILFQKNEHETANAEERRKDGKGNNSGFIHAWSGFFLWY